MITLRPSQERGYFKNSWLESFHTFSFGSYFDPNHLQFGSLRVINQDVISPSQGFDFHGHKDMEIFTYILSGNLQHRDNMGNIKNITAGEVQIMSAGTGVLHSEFNASNTDEVELLQIWVLPDQLGLKPRYDQKTFTKEEKLNNFCLILSPEQSGASLKIFQNIWVWSSLFVKEKSRTFNFTKGSRCWLHVATGEIKVGNMKLKKGDAISVSDNQSLDIQGIAEISDFIIMEQV
jgi:quercetin 2,3-dioxygenase